MGHEDDQHFNVNGDDEDRLFPYGHESTGEDLTDSALRDFARETTGVESAEGLRARFILMTAYKRYASAVRKKQLDDENYYTVDARVRIDGTQDKSFYNKIVLTPDGDLPPYEDPDSMEQLVILFRETDLDGAKEQVRYCLLEHQRPSFRKSTPRVTRYAVTGFGVSRWSTEMVRKEKPIKDELDTLNDLCSRIFYYRLVPQRYPNKNPDGSPTVISTPMIDEKTERALLGEYGVQDFEEREEEQIDNLEQLKEKITDAFIDGFASMSEQTLRDCNGECLIKFSEDRETVSVFLVGRNTDITSDKSGILVTVKNIFEPYIDRWESSEVFKYNEEELVADGSIEIPEDVISRALKDLTIEFRGALGNTYNSWFIGPNPDFPGQYSIVNVPIVGRLSQGRAMEGLPPYTDKITIDMVCRNLIRDFEGMILAPHPRTR